MGLSITDYAPEQQAQVPEPAPAPAAVAPVAAPKTAFDWATSIPTDMQSAQLKLSHLSQLSSADLEKAADIEQARGTYDKDLADVYQENADRHVKEFQKSASELGNGVAVAKFAIEGFEKHEYSQDFLDSVGREAYEAKNAEVKPAESVLSKTGSALKGLATGAVGAVKGGFEGGVNFIKNAAQVIGNPNDAETANIAANNLGSAAEIAIRNDASLAKGMAGFVAQHVGLEKLASSVSPLYEAENLNKAGDKDGAWQALKTGLSPDIRAEVGNGVYVKALGLDRDTMAKSGYQITAADTEEARGISSVVDPSLVLAELGFGIVGKGMGAAIKGAGATKALAYVGKVAQKVVGGADALPSLATKLGTSADEATQMMSKASTINDAVNGARVAAGSATVKLGQLILGSTASKEAGGMLASAGFALAAGADPHETMVAAVSGGILGHFGGGFIARKAIGHALIEGGELLASKLPTPLDLAQSQIINMGKEFSKGAVKGAITSIPFAANAQDSNEFFSTLGGGAGLGGIIDAGERIRAVGADMLVKSRLSQPETKSLVVPSAPLGTSAAADAIHSATEATLSDSGKRFASYLRNIATSKGAESYLASDAAGLQTLYDTLSKTPATVGEAQGVTITAENSLSGKPVALSRVGDTAGQSGGHEVTHALLQAASVDPTMKPLVDGVLTTAADTLGATFDPVTNSVKYSSPKLDEILSHYQDKLEQSFGRPMTEAEKAPIDHLYALHEWVAEHGSVLLSGMPAGKVGGSSGVAGALSRVFSKVADGLIGRRVGLSKGGQPVSSDALPYSISFDLMDSLGKVIRAHSLEGSPNVPDASFETTQPKPEKSTTPVSPKNTGTTFDGGTGVLNPIPKELASDQSTGTPATPVSSKNTSTSFDGGAGILNPIPKELASGQATDAPTTQVPSKSPSTAVDSGQQTSDPSADVTPRAPVRGTQVAADRALTEAPLTDREKREISFAQKDKSLIPVAERVMSHIKSLGGQNTGLPMFEVNYKDKTTGDVSSKRVAPYKTKTNVDGSINVFAVDLDRPLFLAKKLFDWTADKGNPDRFGYTGVNDPTFTKDLGVYLKNQAESRRGSGKPLMIDGKPSTASGQPTETLTRDQELFFSTIMAQKIPDVLTAQSIGAISRIRKTAAASGVDVTTNKLGAVEPNSLREQLVKEGAPIHELYNTDPKTGRVQSNTTGRNSVLMQMKLDGFKSFEPTGQHISQPNSAAIEASFMPAATPEDFTGKSVGGILAKKDWTIFSAENPANKALSASENAQRNATLESELTNAGYTVTRVKGKYNRDENSLLVTGISGEKAREFGAKHGQESILTNKGIEYMNGDLEPATGVDVHTEKPSDFFTTLPDGTHFTVNLGDKVAADSIEGQTAKADATIDDTAKSAAPALSYMPAAKGSLANEQVKTKDVQYKRSTPLEGAVGGVLDVVHFSSKDLSTIDPKESFGKGAATAADQRGNPKAFFYKKGTSYEYNIMHRGEVYSAKIDGNSIYDLNADALDLHQKFSNNYAKMDAAIREAGFAGYSANGSAFDSVSMYDPVKLKSVRPEDVMSRRQLQDSGRKEVSPQETGELDKLDARTGQVTTQQEKLVADNKAALLGSPKYEAAGKRIAAEVGDSYSYEYRSKLDDWADEQAQKMSQKANDGADAKTKASYAAHEAKWTAKDQSSASPTPITSSEPGLPLKFLPTSEYLRVQTLAREARLGAKMAASKINPIVER